MVPSDPEVSKCIQSKWPSNCTGFRGHHVMRNSSIGLQLAVQTTGAKGAVFKALENLCGCVRRYVCCVKR